MKKTDLCTFILISFIFLLSTVKAQFYPVPGSTVDISWLDHKDKEVNVDPFTISGFVTVKEFNSYLAAVKKDSTPEFYRSQLPHSMHMSDALVQAILTDNALQNESMPGVSWSVAQNYCSWLTTGSRRNKSGFTYELPSLREMLAFEQLYRNGEHEPLECWTSNAYDETITGFTMNYTYEAKPSDPPAMKRKIFYGGSYHMNYTPGSAYNSFHYDYQDSSSRWVGFRVARRQAEPAMQNVNNVIFGLKDNHLHGIYEERFVDGKLKVAGEFYHGQRVGMWSVWNSEGVLLVRRDYTGNKNCDFIFPASDHPYKELYEKYPEHLYERTKDGFYKYLYVEERSVKYSSRLWRQLSVENEPELFKSFQPEQFVRSLFNSETKWFLYGSHADFQTEVKGDSLTTLQKESESWDFGRIEVKEDFFFNMDNLLSDTRQIALSFYKNKEDAQPSYTVYYPNVRKNLAKIKIDMPFKTEISNLDDVFFFNSYRGEIVYKSSVYDRSLEEMKQSDWSAELEKLIAEHDLWVGFGR